MPSRIAYPSGIALEARGNEVAANCKRCLQSAHAVQPVHFGDEFGDDRWLEIRRRRDRAELPGIHDMTLSVRRRKRQRRRGLNLVAVTLSLAL